MATYKKAFITIAMTLVWGWTVFMGIWATHLRGRLVSIGIGLLINCLLAFWYSYLEKRSEGLKEKLKREAEE